jgi:hypothetical protein
MGIQDAHRNPSQSSEVFMYRAKGVGPGESPVAGETYDATVSSRQARETIEVDWGANFAGGLQANSRQAAPSVPLLDQASVRGPRFAAAGDAPAPAEQPNAGPDIPEDAIRAWASANKIRASDYPADTPYGLGLDRAGERLVEALREDGPLGKLKLTDAGFLSLGREIRREMGAEFKEVSSRQYFFDGIAIALARESIRGVLMYDADPSDPRVLERAHYLARMAASLAGRDNLLELMRIDKNLSELLRALDLTTASTSAAPGQALQKNIDEWIRQQMENMPDYAKSQEKYRASWVAGRIIAEALRRNGPFGELTDIWQKYVVDKTRAMSGGTQAFFNDVGRQLVFRSIQENQFRGDDPERGRYSDTLAVAAARVIVEPAALARIIDSLPASEAESIRAALKRAGY